MAEEKTIDEKLKSRKFVVWVVWLIITILVILFCTAVMIVTHNITQELTSLIEKVLGWFFAISMMYLGVNAGQKAAFAIGDALSSHSKTEEEK